MVCESLDELNAWNYEAARGIVRERGKNFYQSTRRQLREGCAGFFECAPMRNFCVSVNQEKTEERSFDCDSRPRFAMEEKNARVSARQDDRSGVGMVYATEGEHTTRRALVVVTEAKHARYAAGRGSPGNTTLPAGNGLR